MPPPRLSTVTIVVLDSVGVGALPDAEHFGDAGAHTLDHSLTRAGARPPALLPNLARLGLGAIPGVASVPAAAAPLASFGRMAERSPGKDTTTGHWEFMGVVLEQAFKTYPRFPDEVMQAFEARIGRGTLGNLPASGTAILDELGPEHLRTGKPIVYTSADSVFQVAAHTEVIALETLYHYCQIARELLQGEHAVARVIARPFAGKPGAFTRLGHARKDFSLEPPYPTVLDGLKEAGLAVIGVGKIPDIYARRGFSEEIPTRSNLDGVDQTLKAMRRRPRGLVMTNLVEFDSLYGHRRDPEGYTRALEDFDARLPELMDATDEDGLLILVSDHGNDPTWPGSDHTREYGLLLAYSPALRASALGSRSSFADLGATVAVLLGVSWEGQGESFADLLEPR